MNKDNKKEIFKLKYAFNKKMLYRDLGDMLIAYNPQNSDMYEFNEIGGEIFKLLEREETFESIFNILTDEYNVTIEDIYEDVCEIIIRMLELNIINKI